MKQLLFTLSFSMTHAFLFAQLFTKLNTGAIVNTPTDSRSVNIVDLNNDNWEDIFISNGLSGGQNDLLYLNNGDGSFSESSSDISNDGKSSVGATFSDYDNDGDLDAYVTNWYGQVNGLFKNDGAASFSLQDMQYISQPASYAETASWGDFDNDGWLDLYVTNSGGNLHNLLYKNQGDGTFLQIDTGLLVVETDLSRNADWFDIDDDGDLDLLVSNEDNQPNDLYLNNGGLSFSKASNIPLVTTGRSSQSFSYGDIDNDGDLDLFFANAGFYQEQDNQLYRNEDGEFVLDNNSITSTDGGCSYSSSFADYDNDGDLDLLVTNGFCNSNLKNYCYENQGDGTFVKKTDLLPDLASICSYGAAWGDLNNDGFLDLVIANCKNSSASSQPNNDIYFNNGNGNHWLQIKLVGTVSNRAAIGAKVQVTAVIDGQLITQRRNISAQSGYASQNSLVAHFGLGNATSISELKVYWPSGIVSTQLDIAVDQKIVIEEEMTTAITEPQDPKNKLRISPNPGQGDYVIQMDHDKPLEGELKLRIIDSMGAVVYQQLAEELAIGDTLRLHLFDLPAGKYIVGIYSGGEPLGEEWLIKL